MYESSPRWSSNDRKKAFITLVMIFSLVAISAGVLSFVHSTTASARTPTAAASLAAQPLSGWRLEVSTDSSKNGQRLSARFVPGQVCFVPAGAAFTVLSEPAAASGMLVEDSSAGTWDHEGGELNPAQQKGAAWQQECRAPMQPGLYRLAWRPDSQTPRLTDSQTFLDVMVITQAEAHVQADRTTLKVNGKSIGAYLDPEKSPVRRVRENAHQYRVPQFFATLTQQSIALKLGPDFDLGQLVAFKDYHGPDGRKVYTTQRHTDVLPLRLDVIEKLIKLRERLRSKGVKVTKFWITSGFRTPDYNKSIGGASYSRHCYGDAIDLCIDEDDDKKMDDLNGDGRIDRKDGLIIANACRELELEGAVALGGIGVYEWQADDSVGSHVHIDCRGYISRWGQIGSGRTRKSFIWWPKAEFQEDENGE